MLLLLLLFLLVLARTMMADGAPGHSTKDGVMARIMSRDTSDHRTFDASLGKDSTGHQQKEG